MDETAQQVLYELSTAPEYVVVGRSVTRVDSLDKVLGKSMYSQDNYFKGMAFARIVRAPVPSAVMRGIDFSESARVDGFITGVTASDIPGRNQVGVYIQDQTALAEGVIRYHGEAIGIVVGSNPQAANLAREKVRVLYTEKPAVFDPLEALLDKILVHEEKKTNVAFTTGISKGDIERGLSSSYLVVDRTYRTGYQEHAYMETEGAVAIPTENSITIISSGQYPHLDQRTVAGILNLPESHVRVTQATIGGSFGGKLDMGRIAAAQAAIAAWKIRRPVMLLYNREDSIVMDCKRAPSIIRYKTGVDAVGNLLAVDVDITFDVGTSASRAPGTIRRATFHAAGPYVVPNVRVNGKLVYTNKVFQGAFRGFGNPQVLFAAERNLEVAAEKLGMDPMDIRIKNALREGLVTCSGQVAHGVGLVELLQGVRKASDWDRRKNSYGNGDGEKVRGIGVACAWHGLSTTNRPDLSTAYLIIRRDGSVNVYTGIVEMGQGTSTGMSQIAAEALGVPLELVMVHTGTTDSPDTSTTAGERGLSLGGAAVQLGGTTLSKRLGVVAAQMLGCRPDDVVMREGKAFDKYNPSKRIEWADLVKEAYERGVDLATVAHLEHDRTWDETGIGLGYPTYTYMVVVSEIEIDRGTGAVRVLKVWPGLAAGKLINPALAEVQIHGSVSQGVGYAIMEEVVVKGGKIMNPNLTDYLIPTVKDMPDVEPAIYVEDNYRYGPFGAKGLGELGTIAMAPAITNAYQSAMKKEVTEIPLTPEKSLSIIEGGGQT